MDNPFPYSADNKRYQTFVYYCRRHFGRRIYKVPLQTPFSCPNRDGTVSTTGCLFCQNGSSGFPLAADDNLLSQYRQRQAVYQRKWPDGLPFAYFQSYSNTYAPLSQLKAFYQPFLADDSIAGLVIATRCDCLDEAKIEWLAQCANKKTIWLELGLQSSCDATLKEMNRGHNAAQFAAAVKQLDRAGLWVSVHIIDGWPSETAAMMMDTARFIAQLPVKAVKIHMLHVLKDTPLAAAYTSRPFNLLSLDEYTDIVIRQLEVLPAEMVIERLTGDGMAADLVAPLWTRKKIAVIDSIDKKMAAENSWQGKNYARL